MNSLIILSLFAGSISSFLSQEVGTGKGTSFEDAVAVWHMAEADAGDEGQLAVRGSVELGVELAGRERDASSRRGGDGRVATFAGRPVQRSAARGEAEPGSDRFGPRRGESTTLGGSSTCGAPLRSEIGFARSTSSRAARQTSCGFTRTGKRSTPPSGAVTSSLACSASRRRSS